MSTIGKLGKRSIAALIPTAMLVGFALVPAAAQAGPLEEGHPEGYENGALIGNREHASVEAGFGEIHLESAQLGSEGIECVNVGFGSVWNEGTPLRAHGQILGWVASGHAPNGTHTKLAANCRPEGTHGFATDEAAVEFEKNPTTHEVEPARRKLSAPWNGEISCGVREEEYVGIIRIGMPNTEFPNNSSTPCPAEPSVTAQEEEEAAYVKEREEKKGCYVSNPAPEGCINVTIVEPGAGLEVAFGGTLWAKGINGVKNGLSPSKWVFEEHGGQLECESAGCSAGGTTTGEVKELGYTGVQLIQAK
jgi:hypothetical protein